MNSVSYRRLANRGADVREKYGLDNLIVETFFVKSLKETDV